jgi:hypothetical protein
MRLEAIETPRSANDDHPTERLDVSALREMALRCASDVGEPAPRPPSRAPIPSLVDLLEEDVEEDIEDAEAAFFAEPAPEPPEAPEPASLPAPPAPRYSDVPEMFRREILGEGYYARRLFALVLLAASLVALGGDVFR